MDVQTCRYRYKNITFQLTQEKSLHISFSYAHIWSWHFVFKFKRLGKIKLGVKATADFHRILECRLIFCMLHFARINYLNLHFHESKDLSFNVLSEQQEEKRSLVYFENLF